MNDQKYIDFIMALIVVFFGCTSLFGYYLSLILYLKTEDHNIWISMCLMPFVVFFAIKAIEHIIKIYKNPN